MTNDNIVIHTFAIEILQMRYITLFYLILITLLFVGTACENQRGDIYLMGFSQCTIGDDWRKTMMEEIMREKSFYREPTIEIIVKDANNDNRKQIEDINELVAMGIDLLIVSPNEAQPLTPIVEEVYEEVKENSPLSEDQKLLVLKNLEEKKKDYETKKLDYFSLSKEILKEIKQVVSCGWKEIVTRLEKKEPRELVFKFKDGSTKTITGKELETCLRMLVASSQETC